MEVILQVILHRALEPLVHRNPETHLGALEDRAREELGDRLLEQVLLLRAPQLKVVAICYGHQLILHHFGAEVAKKETVGRL